MTCGWILKQDDNPIHLQIWIQTGHHWFAQRYSMPPTAFSSHDMLCMVVSWLAFNHHDKTHSFPFWNSEIVLTQLTQLKSWSRFSYISNLESIIHFTTCRNICAYLFVVSEIKHSMNRTDWLVKLGLNKQILHLPPESLLCRGRSCSSHIRVYF